MAINATPPGGAGRSTNSLSGMAEYRATLVLCPTALERRVLEEQGTLSSAHVRLEICGFGPIVAAARTAELIAKHVPSRVVLVGIAGSYDAATLPPGTALEFDEVAVDGVGVGEGTQFLPPASIGFPQWPGDQPPHSAPIVDVLALSTSPTSARVLLTTCAASADAAHAARRRARFPNAVAEDMEGFAVAAACALAGVPLRIVRGISNVAGDRVAANWCIPAALGAARAHLMALLGTDSGWKTP